MVSEIDATWGLWISCAMVIPFMYGIGVLQAFLYFQWYPEDPWSNKLVVISVCVLETLQVVLFERATYFYLVEGITTPQNLALLKWEDSGELLCIYVVSTIVQGFFARSIWKLMKGQRKRVPVVLIICVFGLVSLGGGIAQTVQVLKLSTWPELQSTKAGTSVQSGFALGCDLLITITLCVTLHAGRRNIRSIGSTNALVNKLIVYAVNRGILTTIFQALNLILFLAFPNTFWFFVGLAPSSKLYMNSLLAMLNSREYVRSTAIKQSSGSNSFAMNHGDQMPKFAPNPHIKRGTQAFSTDLTHVNTDDGVDSQYKPGPLVV